VADKKMRNKLIIAKDQQVSEAGFDLKIRNSGRFLHLRFELRTAIMVTDIV